MKTRTKQPGKTANAVANASKTTSQARAIEQSVAHPPNVFILPKELHTDARIVSIPSATNITKSSQLLVCPDKGFYEFTNVAEERSCRSWLLAPKRSCQEASRHVDDQGYVLQRPDLLIATPLDPVFVILAMMALGSDAQDSYLSCSDYIFTLELSGYEQLQQLLRQSSFSTLLRQMESRMVAIADSISLGEDDDIMYRLSVDKLTAVLVSKAVKMASSGLPASIEERFVQQALEIPVAHTSLDDLEDGAVVDAQSDAIAGIISNDASQDSTASAKTTPTGSTAATSVSGAQDSPDGPSKDIIHALRVRTAWDYMLRAYINNSHHQKLTTALHNQKLVDMIALQAYDERMNGLRQKAQALRTLSDNISRKRMLEDNGASAKADEKRRKKEEEEQRKKSISHGVKKLMKADTSGMKKLSSFFAKPTAK